VQEARFDNAIGRHIQDWSVEVAGDEIGAALEQFVGPDRTMDDDDVQIFSIWFHNDRELPGGGTPAERFAARHDLPAEERKAAARIAAAKLGLHRVLAVEPGRWIELEDVLAGTTARVQSATVSREAIRWDLLLGRLMAGDPQSLWGPVRLFEPDAEQELLAELRRLAGGDGGGSEDGTDLSVAFKDGALELMHFRPPSWNLQPSFFTPEGDPMSFCQATWRLHKPALARDRIHAFGELLPDDPLGMQITVPRHRLLPEARPPLPKGSVVIETGSVGDGDNIPIATVSLKGTELHVEAMSEQRLERAIEAIDADFGDIAEPLEREITSIEERRLLSGFLADHMCRWLDEPLPALGGDTPREAAKGERREDLLRLVRGIENKADRSRRRGEPGVDVAWLRAELAIDEDRAA